MVKAVWKGQVIAETAAPQMVDGNVYYPRSALKSEFFTPNSKTTVCGWKGTASYFDIKHAETGEVMSGGAWSYPETKPAADKIKGYVAFYPPVQHVEE